MRLILFDIDGTLIRCGPQVRPLFADALRAVYGRVGNLDSYDFSGKTDPQIVYELMLDAGLNRTEITDGVPELRRFYLEQLEKRLDPAGMLLLPGIVELLESLASRSDVILSLLTGNWELGARIKLSRFDLNRFFAFGAFGDDGEDRCELPPVALERALQETQRAFAAQDTLIIGDSIQDITCAAAHDIPMIAVTTGFTDAATLSRAGAPTIWSDLAGRDRDLVERAWPNP